MARLFVSYAHEDYDFADKLRAKLQEKNIAVWMDVEMSGGDSWRYDIDRNIADACALILIISPDAKKSEYVTYEWSYALGLGKKIIPSPYAVSHWVAEACSPRSIRSRSLTILTPDKQEKNRDPNPKSTFY